MKNLIKILTFVLISFLLASCEKEGLLTELNTNENLSEKSLLKRTSSNKLGKATGSVEIEFNGGKKGNMENLQNLKAYFEFNAHEGNENKTPKGELIYKVVENDYTIHREIKAIVRDVLVDGSSNKAWIIGEVVADTKGCGGGPGGHDTGCTGGHSSDQHGEPGDDVSHDSGCSHETGETDHESGCSHETGDTDHESGCSHETGETDEGHSCEGGTDTHGSGSKGNALSGKNCRVGQIIALKVHDVGTPGTNGDGITWKWFLPDAGFVPQINNISAWPHLCKKIILGGNIVVHK